MLSKKRKYNTFMPISNNDPFINKIIEEMNKENVVIQPFVHDRRSPFIDVALNKGRVSPFDENGVFIK